MVRMVSDRLAHSAKNAGKAVCFGVIAAPFNAEDEQAHAVQAKSAKCSWWFSVMNDRRFVMRPAPSVVRATSGYRLVGSVVPHLNRREMPRARKLKEECRADPQIP